MTRGVSGEGVGLVRTWRRLMREVLVGFGEVERGELGDGE